MIIRHQVTNQLHCHTLLNWWQEKWKTDDFLEGLEPLPWSICLLMEAIRMFVASTVVWVWGGLETCFCSLTRSLITRTLMTLAASVKPEDNSAHLWTWPNLPLKQRWQVPCVEVYRKHLSLKSIESSFTAVQCTYYAQICALHTHAIPCAKGADHYNTLLQWSPLKITSLCSSQCLNIPIESPTLVPAIYLFWQCGQQNRGANRGANSRANSRVVMLSRAL